MSNKLQPVRGTKDIYFEDYLKHKYVIDTANAVTSLYGYTTIATPIFEFTEVFKRTLGDVSDVVTKEMYTFIDRGGDSITLRPEFTAGIARALISNGLAQDLPLKFFSHGPLFRHERPQKGRFRQFHQINAESLGIASPYQDSEIIAMGAQILSELGILEKTRLEINTLGDLDTRQKYRQALVDYFNSYKNELSEESKVRLEKNPLRILDSKDEGDKKIAKAAPIILEYLTNEASDFFEKVKEGLAIAGVKYQINPHLVRGLDYYCHTAFEFITEELGTQGTVLGGGRYDGLVKILGGPETPAVGFAAGIERIAELLDYKAEPLKPIAIIPIDQQYLPEAMSLAHILREHHFGVTLDYTGNVAKRMKRANKLNAALAIFIGEEEIAKQVVKVRNLSTGEEKEVQNNRLIDYLGSELG
jgi:histidyl-tRNA synthetase